MSRRRTYNKRGASGNSGQFIIACPASGYLNFSDDYGETWRKLMSAGSKVWGGVAISSDGNIIVAAEIDGYIHTSRNYGETWQTTGAAELMKWRGVAVSKDGDTIVAIESGSSYISQDGGKSWTRIISAGNPRDVSMSNTGQNIVISRYSQLAISMDFGKTWAIEPSIRDTRGLGVSSNGSKIIIAKELAIPFISSNYGGEFSQLSNAGSKVWGDAAISDNGSVIMLAPYGLPIDISRDGGVTFKPNGLRGVYWKSLAMSNDGRIQVGVGTRSPEGFYMSVDYGDTWRRIDTYAYNDVAINR